MESSSFRCALQTKWQANEKAEGRAREIVRRRERAAEKSRETQTVDRYRKRSELGAGWRELKTRKGVSICIFI